MTLSASRTTFALLYPAATLLLLSLKERSWIHAISRLRVLTALGIVSYGFYILQGIPEEMLSPWLRLWHPFAFVALATLLALFLAMVVAAQLSFRFYEQPFLRLKNVLLPLVTQDPRSIVSWQRKVNSFTQETRANPSLTQPYHHQHRPGSHRWAQPA